ncbi:hypothetical protein, conserved [Babesia bigemina]|uniref:C3H1-type domain-containing protein n=1 Tax=Babesia bigemina TaxID=5866 RepID=A0A061BQZ4_BABBI|nr:hypothetical protein, conserved [Babesia bigemina]CDR71878.1 hypothetical protein, conserved [Babesia bigemina]|eukprot:XP_012770821.1 hypothetical protein, conserved [Babesia bigemina]
MGFLSGVLEAVKNTQTYNVGKNTLQNLVSNEINNHLCSGHEGFKRLFEKLPKEIEKYNRDVKKQNDDITAKINNLEMQLNTMNDKVSKVLENDAVSGTTKKSVQAVTYSEEHVEYAVINIRQYLRDCQYNADRFNEAFDLEQRLDMQTAVNDLNSKLRNDVLVATKAVKHETQRLEQLAQKEWDDYKYMKRTVRATMESLKLSVNGEVKYQVDELVKKLKEKVTEMKNNLEPIRDNLGEYIGHLTAWKSAGDTAVTKAKSQCDEIVSKLNGRDYQQNSGDKGAVKKAAKALQEKAEELRTKAYDAKQQVEQKVQEALKAVHQMNDDLKQDLSKVREAITGEVDKVKQAIGKLYAGITTGESGEGNENQEIKNIVEYFRTKLKEITGSVGGRENPKTGLMGIIFQVREYAKTFQNRFKASIQSMVQQLVECEGIQERLIKSVKAKLGRGNMIRVDEEVKRIIQQRIISPIEAINASSSNLGTKPNVEANLSDIKEYLCNYGKQIDEHLQRANAFLQSYAKQFEHSQNRPEITGDYFISRVVKTILTALQKAVKGAENEFDQFIIDSKIAQLSIATSAAETLEDNVKKALGIGSGNNTVAVDVDKSINNVNAVARQQLPGNSVSSVDLSQATSSFTRYTKHVDQSKLTALQTTNLNAILDANKLPHAIKGINDQVVAETLKDVVEEKNGGDTQIHNKTFSTLRTAVDSSLDKFTEAVEKLVKKDSVNTTVNAYLLDLEKMLKESDPVKVSADGMTAHSSVKGLEKIIGNFTTLKNNLESGPIALADYFIESYADAEKDQTIRNLIDYVYSQVNIAKDLLTTAARRNYVTSVKQLLTAFADKVSQELAPLPAEIERDLRIGFKGLMKTLEDGSTDKNVNGKANMNLLKDVLPSPPQSAETPEQKKQAFENLSKKFKEFAEPLFMYLTKEAQRVHSENNAKKNPRGTDLQHYSQAITKIHDAFNSLLDDLHKKHRYDHKVHNLLDNLSDAVGVLVPKGFAMPNSPVIDGLTSGVNRFVSELEKVYISAYDGQKCELIRNFKTVVEYNNVYNTYDVTDEGRYCAKVCLSIIPMVSVSLNDLKEQLENENGAKKACKMYKSKGSHHSLRKLFFVDNGYDVVLPVDAEHGELNHREECDGERILGHLTGGEHKLLYISDESRKASQLMNDDSDDMVIQVVEEKCVLFDLSAYLTRYIEICHFTLIDKPRTPCNVYEMLVWLTGLPHNRIYDKLEDAIKTYCIKPSNKKEKDYSEINPEDLQLETTSPITAKNLFDIVMQVCEYSHDLLTTIVGFGDKYTTYGCDLANNFLRFSYPSTGDDCLHTVLDILRRVLPTLQFLRYQCKLKAEHHGWYDCKYGKDVRTSKWPCNEHSSSKATFQPNGQAKCEPNCQPTSPLMSYLNDCLPGHLPHELESLGCKSVCKTCPKSTPGMPCLTPLGFKAFSCNTRRGKDICRMINKFLTIDNLSTVFCLAPKPPSSLPEHFGFALSLVNEWHKSRRTGVRNALQDAIENEIITTSIGLCTEPSSYTTALSNAYGSRESTHTRAIHPIWTKADLLSLSKKESCMYASSDNIHCAPYLSTLCHDLYYYLAARHANVYLSWALYLPWKLQVYLKNLLVAFENISCQDWGCRRCANSKTCGKGKHGPDHSCQCKSLIECRGVGSTLYSFGFMFGNPEKLSAKDSKRYCHNFYKQLLNVVSSTYFTELFNECDNFLYCIRAPFIWLNVALWLLSLLYLLHIMVIRLDLLHIKSHLHSPSSHRIAAQSLLAAARVSKLNRVFYLQP